MNARARVALVRAGPLAVLAVLLAILVAPSSLQRLLPVPVPLPLLLAGIVVLLVPALLAGRSPLPATLAIVVPALALASYDESRLDWLRTLKDLGLTRGASASANLFRVALGLGALTLAFATHAVDHACRLRASAIERGVPRGQARASMRVVLARSARHGAIALVGALVVGTLALLAAPLDLGGLFAGRAALIVPLLAIALVVGAAVLLAGGREEASTDDV